MQCDVYSPAGNATIDVVKLGNDESGRCEVLLCGKSVINNANTEFLHPLQRSLMTPVISPSKAIFHDIDVEARDLNRIKSRGKYANTAEQATNKNVFDELVPKCSEE